MRSSCWKAASWWRCQHALPIPIGVLAYDDAFGPDGESRLDIDLAPDELLPRLIDRFLAASLQRQDEVALIAVRTKPGADAEQGRERRRLQKISPSTSQNDPWSKLFLCPRRAAARMRSTVITGIRRRKPEPSQQTPYRLRKRLHARSADWSCRCR
jgi:hypothetical protein